MDCLYTSAGWFRVILVTGVSQWRLVSVVQCCVLGRNPVGHCGQPCIANSPADGGPRNATIIQLFTTEPIAAPSDVAGLERERENRPRFATSLVKKGPQLNNHTLLEFIQSDADVGSLRVTEAILWVYVRRPPGARHHDPPRARTTLWVFRVPPEDARKSPSAEMVASLHVPTSRVGWRRLDVTSAVQWWFARPGERLRLLVDCSSCSGELEAALFTPRKHKGAHKPGSRRTDASHRPFLVVHTAPTPSRRLSRRALQCDKDTKMCCKQNLHISFRELGWDDWIIAPSGYNANYCKGSCASVFRTPDSFPNFHSHLLEELSRYRAPGTLTQCCAPTKLSPMSLIYVDEISNIIKRDVPRMVVEECGCA
ncbi:inhibin beta chain-like isoform X2 [Panulirus ornatus]|uniref:inhibin beta chain-like isoform X2 n=1 Tax=Panulirus ornatus TaxID=150431 RepID=UPI003A8911BE